MSENKYADAIRNSLETLATRNIEWSRTVRVETAYNRLALVIVSLKLGTVTREAIGVHHSDIIRAEEIAFLRAVGLHGLLSAEDAARLKEDG